MLLSFLLVVGLSFVVQGRKFHKHERYHLYKKSHIRGAHRSLVFDIPDHVNKGKKGCKHGGILRKHGEVWSPGPCIPECHCINGEVTCSKLECPDLNCERSIKRKWKCCPECPPITERNGDKCGVRTIGGNGNSSCCNFPFRYNGVLYYTCTYQHSNKPWCAVTANYDRDGVWGTCIDDKTKKKFHPVNGKFQDDMTDKAASSTAKGVTNPMHKILPSLTVNSLAQGHRPMPALDPSYLKQYANAPQKVANAVNVAKEATNILPFSAIRERVSSIWKKIGFKKRVYNMLSKAGGQTVTVALPNGGFLPKAGQSYVIPSQYMRPQPIIPKGGNVVNVANVNAQNLNNNAAVMSQIIVSSYTSMIAPSSTMQVTVASQVVTGQNVPGSGGQIIPSKVTVPQVSLTTPGVTTPNPGATGGSGSVTTPNPGATGGSGSQVTTPNPGATGQGTGSQATTPKPTTSGQGNGTQGTTAVPTTAPQGNGSQGTTPKPTGNVTTQSDAVQSNAQSPAPSDEKSPYKGPASPSDMPANVTILQNLQKQRKFGASTNMFAQQQPWSPIGGRPNGETVNSTSQHGGMNVSTATQTHTPLPPIWSNATAPQSLNNGSVGLPNIVPTTKPPPLVWPNITAPTQSTNHTTGTFVWPNATAAPTKAPVVWPNVTAPPLSTTTAPPISGQNGSAPYLPVFTLPPVTPVNTTMTPAAQGNTAHFQTGAAGAAGVSQAVGSAPGGNNSGSSPSNVSPEPATVNLSQSAPSTNVSSDQAVNPYSSANSYSSSNTYSSSNSYTSSASNSSSNSYSNSNPSSSSSTYTTSDPNGSSNAYSSSNPSTSSSTETSSEPNSSSNAYSSSSSDSSSTPYSSSSSYSDPYQQQQDQSTSDKAKQSEDSSKTKEKEEKEEDNPSAHLYEYMTMQPPSEPLVPDPYEAQRRAAQQARELAEAYNNYLKNFYASHGYGG